MDLDFLGKGEGVDSNQPSYLKSWGGGGILAYLQYFPELRGGGGLIFCTSPLTGDHLFWETIGHCRI